MYCIDCCERDERTSATNDPSQQYITHRCYFLHRSCVSIDSFSTFVVCACARTFAVCVTLRIVTLRDTLVRLIDYSSVVHFLAAAHIHHTHTSCIFSMAATERPTARCDSVTADAYTTYTAVHTWQRQQQQRRMRFSYIQSQPIHSLTADCNDGSTHISPSSHNSASPSTTLYTRNSRLQRDSSLPPLRSLPLLLLLLLLPLLALIVTTASIPLSVNAASVLGIGASCSTSALVSSVSSRTPARNAGTCVGTIAHGQSCALTCQASYQYIAGAPYVCNNGVLASESGEQTCEGE